MKNMQKKKESSYEKCNFFMLNINLLIFYAQCKFTYFLIVFFPYNKYI